MMEDILSHISCRHYLAFKISFSVKHQREADGVFFLTYIRIWNDNML